MNLSQEELDKREVDFIDIAYDPVPPKLYKESEVSFNCNLFSL